MRVEIAIAVLASVICAGVARAATTIYLNRCAEGCTFTPGVDDARTNESSVVSGASNLASFAHGDTSFAAVVACVQAEFAPFDVTVTSADPGDTPHFEIAVAGAPEQIGVPSGVQAIAPLACALVPNGVGFAFANQIGDLPQQICAAAAQTFGNLVGLETVTTCEDAMAFDLASCLPKTFLDDDVACGTTAPAACICGGTTQNSYQRMLATLPEPAGAASAVVALVVLTALASRRAA